MSKTISWPARVTYIFIALALALSLVLVAIPAKTDADPGLTKWTKVTTPRIDYTDWKIRQDSTINSFDMGPDGETIYAVGSVDSSNPRPYLWKSTNHGATWSSGKTAKIQTDWVASPTYAYTTKKADGLTEIFTSFDLVSVAPEDADFVAVAGHDDDDNSMVVFSANGGTKFHYLGDLPVAVEKIYSLDVSTEVDDNHFVAVGTNVGVYISEVPGYAGWQDTKLKPGWLAADHHVTSVAFSPIFGDDETILAISGNATGTWLQSGRWGTEKAWNANAPSPFPAAVKLVSDRALYTEYPFTCSGIALPSDYDGFTTALRKVFVYVDAYNATANKGYLYRINSSSIFPCPGRDYGFGPDIDGDKLFASLAYYGTGITGKFMLGELPTIDTDACCAGVQVWRAEGIDFCCPEWSGASKKPTGQLRALVAFTPDGKKGYAATDDEGKCKESAFSVSWDDGACWNQLSLIDTEIDYLSDVAINGECNTTLLFSVNTSEGCECDSVWFKADDLEEASEYSGVWLREWCGALTGDEIGLIRLAPEETGKVFTVYLIEQDTNKVWHNASSGITKWLDRHCTKITEITDLAVASESIIYALGDDDLVSRSTNNGKKWATAVDAEVTYAHTIAALGDYVLVGSADGGNHKVAYSSDSAATFSRTDALPSTTGEGNVHVAFDTYFDVNDTIYAATDGTGGIHRWVIDVSDDWKDLKAEPLESQIGAAEGVTAPTDEDNTINVSYYGIVTELSQDGNPMTDAAHGGVLYAAYTYKDGNNYYYAGVARCLTPASTPCCTTESWDYLHAKLTVGSATSQQFTREPSSLRICGCLTEATNSKLWAIDDQGYAYADGWGRLWTYEDCFAKAGITLKSVGDGDMVAADPCECWNEKFVLEWERLCNACEYEFDISMDDGFSQIVFDESIITARSSSVKGAGGFYDPPKGSAPSVVIAEDDLDCNTTYYWRVRAHYSETNEKIQSFWSDTWSFTVEAGPSVAIGLTAPDDGATKVAITAIGFTWTSVADATSYDFVLSANADLSSPVATKTGLTSTAYTFTGTLDYDTTYFWQATAMKDGDVFSQSDVSTFTTAPAAVFTCPQCGLTFPSEAALETHIAEAHPPVVPVTPAWVWVVIGLGAVLVITIIVLIFRTRRV